eukprot:5520569-Pyramimonas_sp.AAC.1
MKLPMPMLRRGFPLLVGSMGITSLPCRVHGGSWGLDGMQVFRTVSANRDCKAYKADMAYGTNRGGGGAYRADT